MKKISVLFLMVFLLVGTLGFVVAAEEDSGEVEIPEARGIGFFEDVFDRVGFAFIFNHERKIERALELAEKRLAEAEAFAEEDPERAEKSREKYDVFVARAGRVLEKIEAQKSNDETRSIGDIEKIARIQNKFERHREHVDEIYIRALERFNENNASDEKIERFENFYERALIRSDKMEEKIIQKRENTIEKHKVLAGKSDEELEVILERIESGEGLVDARKRRLERVEQRTERFIAIHELGLEKAQTRLEGSGLSDEQKSKVQLSLDNLDQKLENFREKSSERIETAREKLGEEGTSEDAIAISSISDYKTGTVTREEVKKALISKYRTGKLTRKVLRAIIVNAYKEGKLTREDLRWLIIHSYKQGELTREDVRWLIINAYKQGELTRDDVHWLIIKSYKAGELTLRDVKELLLAAYRQNELTKEDIKWLLQKAYQAGELTASEISEAEVTGEPSVVDTGINTGVSDTSVAF